MIDILCPNCQSNISVNDYAEHAQCVFCGHCFDISYDLLEKAKNKIENIPVAYAPEDGEYQPYIFVSYAHDDSKMVFPVIKGLQDNGFRVWYDAGIEAGTEWPDFIAERIEKCSCFLCFMSKSAVESTNCRQEINFALSEKKDLISIYLSDFKPPSGLRMQLGNFQSLFMYRYNSISSFLVALCKAKIISPCRESKPKPKSARVTSADTDSINLSISSIKKTKSLETDGIKIELTASERENELPQKTKQERSKRVTVKSSSVKKSESVPTVSPINAITSDSSIDYSSYKFPSLSILSEGTRETPKKILDEVNETAERLLDTLYCYGVKADIVVNAIGPRVTRYDVLPERGTRANKILELKNDIALSLGIDSIRMSIIPERAAIGIEIPNGTARTVRLRNILESEEFENSKSNTIVCLGENALGEPICADISKMPHVLLGGANGTGKSTLISSMITSMLYKARPDEVKLVIVDTKRTRYDIYNGIPLLLVPVISDPKKAVGTLMWAVEEIERRFDMLSKISARNIDAYNDAVSDDPSLGDRMPKIIMVIDDLADLMHYFKDSTETYLTRIAQKARGAGIHLIISTCRSSVNVITGVVKANIPSRVAFKTMSLTDSKAMDCIGAEMLGYDGDALLLLNGHISHVRLQCAYLEYPEIKAVVDHLKKQNELSGYNCDVINDIDYKANALVESTSKKSNAVFNCNQESPFDNPDFVKAVDIAVDSRRISTSLIQRKMSIGYGKAAKLIDMMEELGIVGPANGQRPREVYMTAVEWQNKLKSFK